MKSLLTPIVSSIKLTQSISVQSELKPLTKKERDILEKIKGKKSKYFFSTLVGFLILIPVGWVYSLNIGTGFRYHRPSEELMQRIRIMLPYFYFFIFLLIAAYFIQYYRRLIVPIRKDLKVGSKEILYYHPEKYQTPFFAEYYIVTPISKKSRIRVNKEIFDEIEPGSKAAISYSIYSHFIFSIEVDQREILFNETNELVDA